MNTRENMVNPFQISQHNACFIWFGLTYVTEVVLEGQCLACDKHLITLSSMSFASFAKITPSLQPVASIASSANNRLYSCTDNSSCTVDCTSVSNTWVSVLWLLIIRRESSCPQMTSQLSESNIFGKRFLPLVACPYGILMLTKCLSF